MLHMAIAFKNKIKLITNFKILFFKTLLKVHILSSWFWH